MELKKCSCGKTPTLKSEYRYMDAGWGKSYLIYKVVCDGCGARAKSFNTVDHQNASSLAMKAWNEMQEREVSTMKFPKVEVAYNIVFNNTGFDWTDIQSALCEIVEKRYSTLHCISKEYHEKNNAGAVRYEIKGVWCLLYFKVNTDSLAIDVVAIREDNRRNEDG